MQATSVSEIQSNIHSTLIPSSKKGKIAKTHTKIAALCVHTMIKMDSYLHVNDRNRRDACPTYVHEIDYYCVVGAQ
jgi:hypothetical protein